MAKVKTWKNGELGEPRFPAEFAIVRKAVLQVTDIKTNRNKYYAIELHSAQENSADHYRVFTHYGRTDDLEKNPDSGQKECRYFDSLAEAESHYQSIYREKTSARKGYKEIALAASKIGSQQARGKSSGEVDAKTLDKLAAAKKKQGKAVPRQRFELHPGVRDLVQYLYAEATSALTSTVNAKITANGIETPLGILTIGQIEKGEAILAEAYKLFEKNQHEQLERLSGEFYTVIPHRIGRSRAAVASAVLNNLEAFAEKQETLQLMKDMLQVSGDDSHVLYDAQVDAQYQSLKCELGFLDPNGEKYQELAHYVHSSQIKTKTIRVKNIYQAKRPGEDATFTAHIGNQRLLFHGSRIQNWVGLLSRGIVLPKLAVKLGVNRTDAGWLGHGIYFGDAACTSAFYTSPGRRDTRFMALHTVALGKMMDYRKITYGLTAPPDGYDSCHGVRRALLRPSQFDDDEYVIYDTRQQRMDYLVEFTL
jgi:poly [ADP-ribose] polymerase